MISRRTFLEGSSLALAAMTSLKLSAAASNTGPLGRPIGLQLYTVREEAGRDLAGTLEQIAAFGYREVETGRFFDKPAKVLRALFDDAGLAAPSAHYGMAALQTDLQKKIDDVAALGAKYLVCSSPAVPDNSLSAKAIPGGITLDHWKWNAEQLNRIGEQTKKAGIRTAYHNHNAEFRSYDGVVAYDQLLSWTDPALVTMEMDIGWVVTAGVDPVTYLRQHSQRISLLHVKEVRKDAKTVTDQYLSQTTELGRGKVDWQRIFAAADPRYLEHYFVEQENFDGSSPLESARINCDYLRTLMIQERPSSTRNM